MKLQELLAYNEVRRIPNSTNLVINNQTLGKLLLIEKRLHGIVRILQVLEPLPHAHHVNLLLLVLGGQHAGLPVFEVLFFRVNFL